MDSANLLICKSRVISTSKIRTTEPIVVPVRSIDEVKADRQPCTCALCGIGHNQHPKIEEDQLATYTYRSAGQTLCN